MTSGTAPKRSHGNVPWFGGLTCDHLYADCPNRLRGEETLKAFGWWDLAGPNIDPFGSDVCGLCVHRYKQKNSAAVSVVSGHQPRRKQQ